MSHILTVSGSPRQHSRSARLLDHVAAELAVAGHRIEHLRLLDLPAQALLTADTADPAIVRAQQRLDRADGLVIATPVYKAAYTGLLKAWLDLLPQPVLESKAVLPLATGGSLAHALALDYALRPVLQSMGARHVVQGYLVVDRFIETDGPDGVTTVTGDALPGLTEVIEGFRRALAHDAVRLSA
jgi:FMN reductase